MRAVAKTRGGRREREREREGGRKGLGGWRRGERERERETERACASAEPFSGSRTPPALTSSICTILGVVLPGGAHGPVHPELVECGSLLPPLPRPALGHDGFRSPLLSWAHDLTNVICLARGLCARDGRKLKTLPIKFQRCNSVSISSSVRRGCGALTWRILRLDTLPTWAG